MSSIVYKKSNIMPNKRKKSKVRREFKEALKECEHISVLMSDFTPNEVQGAIKCGG